MTQAETVANPETAPQSAADALREARWACAEQAARKHMYGEISQANQIDNPTVRLCDPHYPGFSTSTPFLSPSDLMAFDSIGTGLAEIDAGGEGKDTDALILEKRLTSGTLIISKLDEGVACSYAQDRPSETEMEGGRNPDTIDESIRARFAQSPAHQAVQKAYARTEATGWSADSVQLEKFRLQDDPLGSLAFLQSIGLPANIFYGTTRMLRAGKSLGEVLRTVLDEAVEATGGIDSDELTRLRWGKDVQKTLFLDKQTGLCSVHFATAAEHNYVETANQAMHVKSQPFIETKAGAELVNTLADHGLMFHPMYLNEMIGPGEADRYGSVYTQLSREVAKWVNNPNRTQASKLFVPYDAEIPNQIVEMYETGYSKVGYNGQVYDPYPDDAASLERKVRAKLSVLDVSKLATTPAQVLLAMAQETIGRETGGETFETELPVTKHTVSITRGACFDVTTYYAVGVTDRPQKTVEQTAVDGVPLLEKGRNGAGGAHTYMTIRPTQFNGVMLPKGSLLSRHEDGGWAFLRLTPFAFDTPEDQSATGTEIPKTVNAYPREATQIGGMTIDALVGSTAPPVKSTPWRRKRPVV
jgi:hypothetical protein